jgi:hypothetical protein
VVPFLFLSAASTRVLARLGVAFGVSAAFRSFPGLPIN